MWICILIFLFLTSVSDANSGVNYTIADHTVVDLYEDIPQKWIDEVKKMHLSYPGESHGRGLFYGLDNLEVLDSRFQVNPTWSGSPEAETDSYLRILRTIWTGSGWSDSNGEEDIWTSSQAIDRINDHLNYSNHEDGLNNTIHAFAWGWCWDMTNSNLAGGILDPEHLVHWAGRSYTLSGGDQGRWGLDDSDTALTSNPSGINMNDYLLAFDNYSESNPNTAIIFTTGPVDGSGNDGEEGYQRYLKHEYIRSWVKNGSRMRYLFDYADIISWDDQGNQNNDTWANPDDGWETYSFPYINPSDDSEYDAGQGSCHISSDATTRLGKAMWWLLARIAGWDGNP
ncbi:MAG: hypothetical protein ACLFPQ_05565, partial [Candidatus Woesearchaeota archaeon]